MSDLFDVIVVGAGPGGSNAAAVALKHGLSIAQVDKSRFPRVKPCGGGLTIKSCRALQFDLQPMLRGESREFEFNVSARAARGLHRGEGIPDRRRSARDLRGTPVSLWRISDHAAGGAGLHRG